MDCKYNYHDEEAFDIKTESEFFSNQIISCLYFSFTYRCICYRVW